MMGVASRPAFWVALVLPLLLLSASEPALSTVQLSPTGSDGYNVLSANWGTASTRVSAAPGMQDVPLTLTMQYVYSLSATSTILSLELPSGFTDYNGNPTAETYISGSVATNSIQDVTFYLDIAANASLGDYTFPLDVNWTVSLSSTITQSFFEQSPAEVYLKGAADLVFGSVSTTAVAGVVNPIALTLTNEGTGKAADISTVVSAQGGTVLSQPNAVGALSAGANTSQAFSIFIPSSEAGSAMLISFTSTYVDPYNNTSTSSSSVGIVVSSSSSTGVDLTYASSGDTLAPDGVDSVSLIVTNAGGSLARTVTPTVSASEGATVLYQPAVVAQLEPGSSAALTVSVFVPSSDAGSALVLTLSTTFVDAANATVSMSSSLGFLVSGAASTGVSLSFASSQQSLTSNALNTFDVTVTNAGTSPAKDLSIAVSASGGTVISQPYTVSILEPKSNLSFAVSLFVPSSEAGSALVLSFSSSYVNLYNATDTSTSSVGLLVSGTAGGSEPLSVTLSGNSLVAGETSTVTFEIKNAGEATIYSPVISYSASSPIVVVENSTRSFPGLTLAAGASVSYSVVLSSLPSGTGGTYAGSLAVSYSTASGSSESETLSVGVTLTEQAAQISVKALETSLTVGAASQFTYVVTNTGNVPLYSPSFQLSVSSSLAVLANSTYAKSGVALNPGQSFTYEATVSSGPKTSEGPYSGTLTVNYSDQYGNSHTLSSTVSFVVVAAIELAIQSETTSQSGTTITVSGTILNEGQGDAYYLELVVNATLGNREVGSGSYYVGELDPNTPTAFSVTVTISPALLLGETGQDTAANSTISTSSESLSTTASVASSQSTAASTYSRSLSGNFTGTFTGTGNETFPGGPPAAPADSTTTSSTAVSSAPAIVSLALSGSYENDFGQSAVYKGPIKTLIVSTTTTSTSTNPSEASTDSQALDYARVALAAAIGMAIVGSFIYLRRTRRSATPLRNDGEPEGQDAVI